MLYRVRERQRVLPTCRRQRKTTFTFREPTKVFQELPRSESRSNAHCACAIALRPPFTNPRFRPIGSRKTILIKNKKEKATIAPCDIRRTGREDGWGREQRTIKKCLEKEEVGKYFCVCFCLGD